MRCRVRWQVRVKECSAAERQRLGVHLLPQAFFKYKARYMDDSPVDKEKPDWQEYSLRLGKKFKVPAPPARPPACPPAHVCETASRVAGRACLSEDTYFA